MTAAECLAAQIADPETQWSLGTFGAIAEFTRDPDEPADLRPYSAITGRGGIRLDRSGDLRLFAFEVPTRESWSPRVAICLPHVASAMSQRSVLTEIGPDGEALRLQDRDSILFDVGIDAWQVDVCVRATDPDLIAELRANCGHQTFALGNPAGRLILERSPHRVFLSRVGRIEVYQPIPPPHGKSPDGPHTHVLADLLRHRRTHAATEPIPDGFVPCAHFYPTHPAKNGQGESRPFDPQRQASFEALLRQFGDQQLLALKEQVRVAVAEDRDPSTVPVVGRFARSTIRVALRQLSAAHQQPPSLSAWVATYDRTASEEFDDERHIHHR